MTIFEAIILGILQGLTEFLPVSSSGHLVIGQHLLGVRDGGMTFEILVHAATVLATITVFWRELVEIVRGVLKFKYNEQTRYFLMICVSMIPVLIVGLFFKPQVEALFDGESLVFVGQMLLVTAVLLTVAFFVERARAGSGVASAGSGSASSLGRGGLNYWRAFVVGLAQAVAVVPGISRSGATISTGLLCGVDKAQVARFSFLMVMVPILGEAFLEVLSQIGGAGVGADAGVGACFGMGEVWVLLAGFVAAYLAGLVACRWMIKIVSRGKLYWFAIYCAALGVTAILW